MKRHTVSIPFPPPCRGMRMEEVITVADLIAADALIPVSDGSEVMIKDLVFNTMTFILNGQLYSRYGNADWSHPLSEHGVFECCALGGDTPMARFRGDTIVQPITFKKMKDTQ